MARSGVPSHSFNHTRGENTGVSQTPTGTVCWSQRTGLIRPPDLSFLACTVEDGLAAPAWLTPQSHVGTAGGNRGDRASCLSSWVALQALLMATTPAPVLTVASTVVSELLWQNGGEQDLETECQGQSQVSGDLWAPSRCL